MSRVTVVGAGVVGLSCAVRLLEAGHQVGVVARDRPLETTSAVAAALWYPYRAYPVERVSGWAAATYEELARLADHEETGVTVREGVEVHRRVPRSPWWAHAVPDLRTHEDVPEGYVTGWTFSAPVADMSRYLRWLAGRVEELGGTITRMALGGLPNTAEVVVNASGMGARLLAGDGSVLPLRGQVLRVSQVGLRRWWLDAAGPTYVVPRFDDIVVGGTDEEGSWDRQPDEARAKEILARAVRLVPELERAEVLGHRVGLRPARPAVRLESVTTSNGQRLVHCYGHGGAGVTLSWGCADEVAGLVSR